MVADAVVQITDRDVPGWAETYRRDCLEPLGLRIEAQPVNDVPVRARFSCTSSIGDGTAAQVDHYLVQLPRR